MGSYISTPSIKPAYVVTLDQDDLQSASLFGQGRNPTMLEWVLVLVLVLVLALLLVLLLVLLLLLLLVLVSVRIS